jgi:uncharacterized protein Smg (DUF494 family)
MDYQNLKALNENNKNTLIYIMENYIHSNKEISEDELNLIWDIKDNCIKTRDLIDAFRRKNNLDNDFNPIKKTNKIFGDFF